MSVKTTAYERFYNVYPHRDPICVSHYPNPVTEVAPADIYGTMGLGGQPPADNVGAVYVHVPFCASVCIFCPFNKMAYQEKQVEQYMEAVKAEIGIYASSPYGSQSTISAVTFGGGTPSALSAERMVEMLKSVQASYRVTPDAQISFEGSPATLTLEKMQAIRAQGANRISIGIQTFNDKMGHHLRMSHDSRRAFEVLEEAKEAGFENIGIDLMYNLPEQTMEEWLEDVRTAVRLGIDHITVFSLCVVPFTALFKMIKEGKIPPTGSVELEVDMYLEAKRLLQEEGYVQYSVWDFAKPGFEDRHVLLYYTQQKDLFAHGPAAFGYVNKLMYINQGDIQEYSDRLQQQFLSVFIASQADDLEAMHGMMAKGLRMLSVKRKDFAGMFGYQPEEVFGQTIDDLVAKGLLETDEHEIRLSDRGIVWGNNVCKEFFSEANQQTFESRVKLARGQKPAEAAGEELKG
ncbi:radical SAM family heme chaperone HemW [Paenibacillus sp. FSL H7-0756]|uniref:radical SAM family heme chaperone HemW n=1 Tax=unclassified Paenibacillus TaxID=185978 RepID=UPI00097A5C7F|nr:radical SAM family heme chaperone HemW [Paenibacillus sp. FSL R7-0337]OMF85874.1 hypothetical protein BK147_31095 [Paenibacillus sp. FSL R7-0337]